jgi:putative glutamine amidotransferase
MRIGVTTSTQKGKITINEAYIKYLLSAKYEPVIISKGMDVKTVVNSIDGLLLPGGVDVDPIYYGEDNTDCMSVDPDKDKLERKLLHASCSVGKPVFGICRGFQLIAREYMSTLKDKSEMMEFFQHIDYHDQDLENEMDRNHRLHFVNVNSSSLYGAKAKKVTEISVNSMHHQCLVVFDDSQIKDEFEMLAWTVRGLDLEACIGNPVVCEAFKIKNWKSPIMAVQWHPEELKDIKLLKNFFDSHFNVKVNEEGNGV